MFFLGSGSGFQIKIRMGNFRGLYSIMQKFIRIRITAPRPWKECPGGVELTMSNAKVGLRVRAKLPISQASGRVISQGCRGVIQKVSPSEGFRQQAVVIAWKMDPPNTLQHVNLSYVVLHKH